ncbi:MAG: methyltransferase domain-containing protein [Rickettsiales bacterium]
MSALLQQNFSRHAAQYEARAHFQRTQCARVADAALMLLPAHARVLDVGCGTGMFRTLTAEKRPHWQWIGLDIAPGMCAQAQRMGVVLQANAASIPLADASVDAVVSSLCLQWVPDLNAAMGELQRVLRPGGRAMIATLVEGTLDELREAATHAALRLSLLPMRTVSAYRAAIENVGLGIVSADCRADVEHYATVSNLLNTMRGIGAGSAEIRHGASLTGAERWRGMLRAYEAKRGPQGLPVSWHTWFAVVSKP